MFTQQEFDFLIDAISEKANGIVSKLVSIVQQVQMQMQMELEKPIQAQAQEQSKQKPKETKKEKSE